MVKLKILYLWSWLLIGILLNLFYILAGALEGYGLPNLMEFVFAGVIAILPTILYFIFKN